MSDSVLRLDYETYSECDIKSAGAFVYAAHPSTDILCAAYAFDDEEPELWLPGQPCPERIRSHVETAGTIVAYNVQFEENIWENVAGPKYGWPIPKPETLWCAAAQAASLSLPRDLGSAGAAIGTAQQKDDNGRRVMLQLSRPRSAGALKGTPWTPEQAPDKHATLREYCLQDVRAERDVSSKLFQLSPREREIFLLDRTINRRGVRIDRALIQAAGAVVEQTLGDLDAELASVTSGAVTSATQTARLTEWLSTGKGVWVTSVAAHEVERLLAVPDLEPATRRALEIRQEAAMSSTAKLKAMLAAAGPDGRIRGSLLYAGTVPTLRWAGRLHQPQNLPRGTVKDVDGAVKALMTGDANVVRLLYGSPMEVVSSCLRGCMIPADGHEFIAADFSAIEARGLAWLAGQEDILAIFRGHGRIYEHAAAGIYKVPLDAVSKDQRQIGKTAVLALGYGGWVGAFQKMAQNYGLQIQDEQAAQIAGAWREANPSVVRFWADLNEAAFRAVANPGRKFEAGPTVWLCVNGFLWCRLPSGRVMAYPRPTIQVNDRGQDAVHTWGVDQFTRKWTQYGVYGGMLSNHVTQGTCRDLLAEAMLRLEHAGYPVVLTCHDEVLVERQAGAGTVAEMEAIMTEAPAWATGLPLAAEGWAGARYRK